VKDKNKLKKTDTPVSFIMKYVTEKNESDDDKTKQKMTTNKQLEL